MCVSSRMSLLVFSIKVHFVWALWVGALTPIATSGEVDKQYQVSHGSAVFAFDNDGTVAFLVAVRDTSGYAYGFVNGAPYLNVIHVQCAVHFAPSVFNVSVVVAINFLVVLVVMAEAIWTYFWTGLPWFNSLDSKNPILEASAEVTALFLLDAADARTDSVVECGVGAVRVVVRRRKELAMSGVGSSGVGGRGDM